MNRGDHLLADYIERPSSHPGIADARIAGSSVPVWAIIGYLRAADWDIQQTADDYGIAIDAVNAAIAFYELHQEAIDARISANVIRTG